MSQNERTYTVAKNQLIGILESNREKHIAEFKAAVVEFRKKATAALEKRLGTIKEGGKKFDLTFSLPQPVNYVKQYDKIIGVLKLSSDTELKITYSEYTQWVLNEWSWDHHFKAQTMSYSNALGSPASNDNDDISAWSEE